MLDRRQILVLVCRWCGRIVATTLGVFLIMFLVGNKEAPPPFLVLVPWLIVLAAFVLGWRHEVVSAALLIAVFIFFNVFEFHANGRLLRFGAFHLLLLPAGLFLIAAGVARLGHRAEPRPA